MSDGPHVAKVYVRHRCMSTGLLPAPRMEAVSHSSQSRVRHRFFFRVADGSSMFSFFIGGLAAVVYLADRGDEGSGEI